MSQFPICYLEISEDQEKGDGQRASSEEEKKATKEAD